MNLSHFIIFTIVKMIPDIPCVIPECGSCRIGTYNIYYRSDTYGFGWVSQEPAGQDSISPFCLHRDGKITYTNYSVDYGTNELTYELSFLDPTFPFHKIKGTAYFEGNSNRTYELWVNGEKKHIFTVRPNKVYDFNVLIPRELYQHTQRINLSIKNPANTGVCLAGLSVYRKIDAKSGGPQSLSDEGLESKNWLIVTPNPFSKKTEIRMQIPDSGPGISLKIYDSTGRLVRQWDNTTIRRAEKISWDGTNNDGSRLPAGVYFIHLQIADERLITKVILLK